MGVLHIYVARPKDITKERKQVLAIPAEEREKYDNSQMDPIQSSENRFIDALHAFGGLYHPNDNRNSNPVLYLYYEPSTYKTFLIKTIFDNLVGIDSVDIL